MKRLLAMGALALITTGCEALLGDLDHTYRDNPAAAGMGGTPNEGGGGNGGTPGVGGSGGEPIIGACGTPLGIPINFAYEDVDSVAAQWCFLEEPGTQTANSLSIVEGGAVEIAPGSSNEVWFEGATAPFVHTVLEGDFGFFIQFSVEVDHMLPCREYNGGGILVREPGSISDWLLFDLSRFAHGSAAASDCGGIMHHAEEQGRFGTHVYAYDAVVGGMANFSDAAYHTIEMGVCRIGDDFEMYTRGATAAQSMPARVASVPGWSELPDQVEVGFTAHRYTVAENLVMVVRGARVEPDVETFASCRDALFPKGSR